MSDEILIKQDGPVLELRFNRPDKKNAITSAMYAQLADALAAAAKDDGVHAVTLGGEGGIFTAGNDLKDFQQSRPDGAELPVHRFLSTISSFPKVIIAGISGQAVGVGTTMLLHCDLIVASPAASFSLPFVDLGLVPEAASSLLLPALIGRHLTAKHLILGDPIDAATALQYGLVTELVAEAELDDHVRRLARRIAAKPPAAVRLTKQLLQHDPAAVRDRMAREGALFAERLRSAEAAEAFTAFFEKRPPDFSRTG